MSLYQLVLIQFGQLTVDNRAPGVNHIMICIKYMAVAMQFDDTCIGSLFKILNTIHKELGLGLPHASIGYHSIAYFRPKSCLFTMPAEL